MSLPVFIAADLHGDRIVLDGAEGRHAVAVKRLRVGEQVKLIDGAGAWVTGTVRATSGKDVLEVDVDKRGADAAPRPRVTVVQAVPKAERSELAVDLMTQAGADAIVAWQAQRSVAKWTAQKADKHLKKWQYAAAAAAKQARRSRIPAVQGPLSTAEVARLIHGAPAVVLHEDADTAITDLDLDVDELFLVVGPEGGIGDEELAELGARAVRCGPEVYRTASAAMVALSAIGALTPRW